MEQLLNIPIAPANSKYTWSDEPTPLAGKIASSETVAPRNYNYSYGEIVKLSASQNLFSFDYYEIHEPIEVVQSSYCYKTIYGFVASYDPNTTVKMNYDSYVTGSYSKIIARYRP